MIAVDIGDLCRERQLGLLPACQRVERRLRVRFDQIVGLHCCHRPQQTAMRELDQAAGLIGVEQEGQSKRLKRITRGHDAVDGETIEKPVELRHLVAGEAVIFEDLPHDSGKRPAADAARQPVPELPIAAVGPYRQRIGKGGVRPGIPSVDEDAGRIDHAPAIDARHRVLTGHKVFVARIEEALDGLDVAALNEIVAHAAREIRRETLRALRIDEHVGLVRALSTAGQPISVNQIGFDSGTQAVCEPLSTPPGRL
ncbi:hypothetical protein AUC71_06815 [Methyloceanibacter marginalis]|uniref:Uncharacterized protein n=1 Tax=Methyloceanibacter marginalis TaxID=1774971 RepID=A0A1E3WDN7_9HYPH|nr:hypothetical protein AUC71_06815 [Methyloceanibacter marginalis]